MPPSENSFPISFGEPAPAQMLVQGPPFGASDLQHRRSLLVQVSVSGTHGGTHGKSVTLSTYNPTQHNSLERRKVTNI